MDTTDNANARIFLTDYASYNEGRQFEFGHWLDLDRFEDYEALMGYIRDHFTSSDALSPLFSGPREEIMITDFEGFPRSLYCESGNLKQIMDYLQIVKDSHLDADVFEAYLAYNDIEPLDDLQERVEDAYQGKYDSDRDFAQSYAGELGYLSDNPRWPYTCIDWEWAYKELDCYSDDGHYFMD